MKVKVLREFVDINNFTLKYSKGDEIEVSETRAADLIKRGLAESAESVANNDGNKSKGKNKSQQAESAESANS